MTLIYRSVRQGHLESFHCDHSPNTNEFKPFVQHKQPGHCSTCLKTFILVSVLQLSVRAPLSSTTLAYSMPQQTLPSKRLARFTRPRQPQEMNKPLGPSAGLPWLVKDAEMPVCVWDLVPPHVVPYMPWRRHDAAPQAIV